MPSRQINIRIPEEDAAVLEAQGFLTAKPVGELVREVVNREIAALRKNPRIRDMIRLKAEQAAVEEGDLSSLEEHRSRAREGVDE